MVSRLVISLACRKWGIYQNEFLPSHLFSWQSVYIVNKKTSILLLINQDRSKHPSQFIYHYIFLLFNRKTVNQSVWWIKKPLRKTVHIINWFQDDWLLQAIKIKYIIKTNNFWLNQFAVLVQSDLLLFII